MAPGRQSIFRCQPGELMHKCSCQLEAQYRHSCCSIVTVQMTHVYVSCIYMYYTVNMTHVCATYIYFMHTCIHLYIILLLLLLLLLSYSKHANNWLLQGESPETFSIQVDMRRVVFYVSIHQLFISFGGRGSKGNIALYKALIGIFCKIM